MKSSAIVTGLLTLVLSVWTSTAAWGQAPGSAAVERSPQEAAIVDGAGQVLNEIMAIPARGIPRALLADARGIAIVPGMIKGGFVIGVRHGRGVVLVRDEGGGWQPPVFVTMTGGSLGLQAGIQASDLILVFKTHKSIQGLMSGKFTIGADASAAAGPVGREAAAATDATLRAEIYSYSRSRGLFAGVSLDGSAMVIDREGYARYYGPPGPGPGQVPSLPPSAARLLEQVARHAVTETAGAAPVAPMAPLPPGTRGADAQNVRRQLADSSVRLASLLDDNWKRYLALPAEIYSGDRPPPAELVNQSLARFNAVAANPQYQTLWQRPEFQETMSLLKRYAASQNGSASLPLPPPPR